MRALSVLLLCVACGGSPTGSVPPPPPPPLDPGFGGTWVGPTSVVFEGNPPSSYIGRLDISVSRDRAVVLGVCPDGSGSVVAIGTGQHAQWDGQLRCPPIAFTACSAVVFTYFSGILMLNGNTLTAQGLGSASGCGVMLKLTTTLIAAH